MIVRTLPSFTAALLLTLACSSPPDATNGEGPSSEGNVDPDGKADGTSPTKALIDYATRAGSARLLQGYTPLFDQGMEHPCVVPSDAMTNGVLVGDAANRFDMVVISSRKQLAKELSIDLDLKIKYGLAAFDANFKFLDTFKADSKSVYLLITLSQSYKVRNQRQLVLAQGTSALANDPSQFLPTCGSHYVSGATYEARLFVAVRFDSASSASAKNLSGALGLNGGFGPVSLNTNFGAKANETAEKFGAGVNVMVASEGFQVAVNGEEVAATNEVVHSLLGEGLPKDLVQKLSAIAASMTKSIQHDRCRDDPHGGGCDGTGPGYTENGSRDAVLTRLDLKPYQGVQGAPKGQPWVRLGDELRRVDAALRPLSLLQDQMASAHREEVEPFVDASPVARNRFGAVDESVKAYDRPALEALAASWDSRLRPGVGTDITPVENLLEQCFEGATAGLFERCPVNVKGTTEFLAGKNALAEYKSHGRILPLVYKPTAVDTKAATSAACVAAQLRLPTRAEAERMAVAVRSASDLPSGGTLPRTVWHSGPASPEWCSAFSNPPEAGSSGASLDKCGPSGAFMSLPALCVPPSGPFDGF